MIISFKSSGSFERTETFFKKMLGGGVFGTLEHYGAMGVAALARATPVESGLTANSWTYEIEHSRGRYVIRWMNTHVEDGVPIAVILEYGHGTGTGGWVAGRDFINPAIQPIFDQIANELWEQVTRG